jgi:hypothetical protein
MTIFSAMWRKRPTRASTSPSQASTYLTDTICQSKTNAVTWAARVDDRSGQTPPIDYQNKRLSAKIDKARSKVVVWHLGCNTVLSDDRHARRAIGEDSSVMRPCRRTKWGAAIAAIVCLCLVGCGTPSIVQAIGDPLASAAWGNNLPKGAPATVAYIWGNDNDYEPQTILEFSVSAPNSTSPLAILSLPASCNGGPLATDSVGELYVACFSPATSSAQVLVYAPNPSGAATPLRVINLDSSYYEIVTLAVDTNDRLYVGALISNPDAYVDYGVIVYPQGASGSAEPLRTLQMPVDQWLVDLAVDGSGNIYVTGGPAFINSGPPGFVKEYSADADGWAYPIRTIDLPYFTYGIAVDGNGNALVTAGNGPGNSVSAIEVFAPEARGPAAPARAIPLTSSPYCEQPDTGGVRVDGGGNIFTNLTYGSGSSYTHILWDLGTRNWSHPLQVAQFVPDAGVNNGYFALH